MGGSAALKLVRDAGLTGLVRRGSEHALDAAGSERLLPVLPELRALLPGGGLRRGATIGVAKASATGYLPGASSLLLALLAEASRAGSWCAVVGVPTLGLAAAAELGIALDRLALVPHPGPDWPTVVAALVDGFDIVVTTAAGGGTVAPAVASRLTARARQRGAVLMVYGPWPSVELTVQTVDPVWHGIEGGRGRLRGRQISVVARGRGAAVAPRLTHMWLPAPSGLLPLPMTNEPAEDGVATVHPFRMSRMAG